MKFILIAACDEQQGIGFKGKLPWHLPADLAFFKDKTFAKPVLMGRKTFDSIGKPLPGRRNIVLSRQLLIIPGVEVIKEMNDLKDMNLDVIMVIGGQQIYEMLLPFAEKIFLTEVHAKFQTDAFFPKFSANEFTCIAEQYFPQDSKNSYAMTFREFVRN
jgi:dihydrofolate reductase